MNREVFAHTRWRGTRLIDGAKALEIELERNGTEIMAIELPYAEALLLYLSLENQLQSAGDLTGQPAPQSDPTKPIQVSSRKPSSFAIVKNAMTGDPVLVFDSGTPMQLAIEIPRNAVPDVARLLLPYLRDDAPPVSQ